MKAILNIGDSLMEDILAYQDDDVLRLIYADWLMENGQPERAELIRAQIVLAGPECPSRDGGPFASIFCRFDSGCPRCNSVWKQKELLTVANFWNWFGNLFAYGFPGSCVWEIKGNVYKLGYYFHDVGKTVFWDLTVSRGFVSAVRLPHDALLAHGKKIVREQPVERVELSDRTPLEVPNASGDHAWSIRREGLSFTEPFHLAPQLYGLLRGGRESPVPGWREYRGEGSREKAVEDARAACLLWAKS